MPLTDLCSPLANNDPTCFHMLVAVNLKMHTRVSEQECFDESLSHRSFERRCNIQSDKRGSRYLDAQIFWVGVTTVPSGAASLLRGLSHLLKLCHGWQRG